MNNTKFIFIKVTADNCGVCKIYQNFWPDYLELLKKIPNLDIIEINLEDNSSDPNPVEYPSELGRWIVWYPTFLLFTASSWSAAHRFQEYDGTQLIDKSGPLALEGAVYNGAFNNGKLIQLRGPAPTAENLIAWIITEMKNLSGDQKENTLNVLELLRSKNDKSNETTKNNDNNNDNNNNKTYSVCKLKLKTKAEDKKYYFTIN